MTDAGPVAPDAPVTRTGGIPLAPAGTEWPHCAECTGPMQFLAQFFLEDGPGAIAVFMCQNQPGLCQAWDPVAGGNRALLFPSEGLVPVPLPGPDGEGTDADAADGWSVLGLGAVRAVARAAAPEPDYFDACAAWAARTGRATAEVLGQLGGTPYWLQNDETPDCPGCAQPMAFTAQLDEGPDPVTAMNFGSGSAYLHACGPCGRAAFGWQC
ncbi:hypothetical protein DEJ50_06505 [Streptomyces venezuelae]|uniref:DUF1963 domain-containing protein n=2 Tax=Streptomyces venezuelae TaxID=54571 RepID=A0A5P2DDN0_STRVZ|nr:hypothetical protein DEJ50_06505 [Streptomyces venezuelae]